MGLNLDISARKIYLNWLCLMIFLINISENLQTNRAQRMIRVFDYLSSAGFDTRIISSNFDHGLKLFLEKSNGNEILVPVFPYKSHFSPLRMLNHIWFAIAVVWFTLKEREISHIYTSSIPPELLLAVVLLKRVKKNLRITVDVRDVWPDSLPVKKSRKLAARLFKFYSNRIYNYTFQRCDCVIISNPDFKSYLSRFGCSGIVVPLGYDKYRFQESKPVKKKGSVYIGNFNESFDLRVMSDFLNAEERVSLIGDGPLREIYETVFVNVNFLGHIEYRSVPETLSGFEYGLLPITGAATLPNKLYDYYGSGLDVVTNCEISANLWSAGAYETNSEGLFIVRHCNLIPELFIDYEVVAKRISGMILGKYDAWPH